ncbi:TPA: hypothetical protein DEO28_03510 [Candidatus Dependentiae bacterium]|nr:MAG: segregation ATPase ftsK/spoIIIE [candidate division TM6 bacterium GW2011_GWE2_31_21]KKP53636.1 MAG: segregation ATPase ftsK/spoIIIE [candidate division TM6 bacterium GW2011_GWF2_33_332]HBZ73549.1 hypothetical protein [Candidatus Dependentiae bacterium]
MLGRNEKKDIVTAVCSYKREIFAAILIVFTLFLFISLISYSSFDNTLFNYSSANQNVKNWGGFIGVNLAAFLFYLFGSVSFLFFLFFAYFSYLMLFKISLRSELGRLIGFSCLIISLGSLFFAYGIDFTQSHPGGFCGYHCYNFFNFLFGNVGAFLFLYATLWVGSVLLFKISFFSLFARAWQAYGGRCSEFFSPVWNFCKKVILYPFRLIKKLFGFKSSSDFSFKSAESSDLTSLNEKVDQDESFWQGIGQDVNSENVLQKASGKQIKKFVDAAVFNGSCERKITFVKSFDWVRNSVLSKNIVNAMSLHKNSFAAQKIVKNKKSYKLPDFSIFESVAKNETSKNNKKLIEEECKIKAKKLEEKLLNFGIKGSVTQINPGPVVTLFEYTPEIGTKISKILAFEDDLAMVLQATSIRILAPIPGKSAIGFEISNQTRESVSFLDILSGKNISQSQLTLPIVLGVDIAGNTVIEDLVKMPHLLVAGSTGSGKSVALNVMLSSLLCKFSPEELKLILVDPKHLEFSSYKDIPHLLYPIVTDSRKAALVLKWVVSQMESRYEKMAALGVRNLVDYNSKIEEQNLDQDKEPFIVVMIDELADLMMVAGREVELCITRIAQMARAAGIHLIVATQRPSVDVLTGLIKVNFPSRIAFRVTSKIDSKVILDSTGAEKLLGRGDMLYLNPRGADLQRVHGAYVSDNEIETLANYLRSCGEPNYLDLEELSALGNGSKADDLEDELFGDVLNFVKTIDEVSISMIQRKYRIGFNRSARLIEQLEHSGIIAPAQGVKARKVLR